MPYIFAYGSNMNQEQMQSRCPSSYKIQNYRLENFQFNFPRFDEEYGGGVAGIIPQKDAYVEGVIYFLSNEDLRRLDGFERVDYGEYKREKIANLKIDQKDIIVDAHIACVQDGYPFKPPQFYADKILAGAKENCLSQSYIETVLLTSFNKIE